MSQQKFESMLAALLSKVVAALETALSSTDRVGAAFGSSRPAGEGPQQHKEQFFIAVFLSDYLLQRMHAVDERIPAKPPRVQPGSFVGPPIDFTPTPARDATPDETTRAKFEGIIHKFVQIMSPKLEEMESTLDSVHRKLNVDATPSALPDASGARSVLVITSRIERLAQALSDIAQRFASSSPSSSSSSPLPTSLHSPPGSLSPSSPLSLSPSVSPSPLSASSPAFVSSPHSPSPLSLSSPGQHSASFAAPSPLSLSSPPVGIGAATGLGLGGPLGGGVGLGAAGTLAVGAGLVSPGLAAVSSTPPNDATQRMQILVQLFSEGFMSPEEYQARRVQIEQQQQLQAQQQQLQAQQAGFGGQSPFDILTAYFTRGLISADEYQLRLSLLQQQQQQQLAGLGLGAPAAPGFPTAAPAVGFPSPSIGGIGAAPVVGLGSPAPPTAAPAGTLSQLQSMLESGLITQEQFAMYTSRV